MNLYQKQLVAWTIVAAIAVLVRIYVKIFHNM